MKLLTVILALVATSGGVREPEKADCAKALSEEPFQLSGLERSDGIVDTAETLFGPSPLRTEGDASQSKAWRCWRAANGDGTLVYVAYVAGQEVREVLGVLGKEVPFPDRDACPQSERVSRKLATENGLRLGMTREHAERKLGRASKVGEGWYEKVCVLDPSEKAAHPSGNSMTASIRVFERSGRAVGFELSWAESNGAKGPPEDGAQRSR